MANNRLYIANKSNETYVGIAKSYGDVWYHNDLKDLKMFLDNAYEWDDIIFQIDEDMGNDKEAIYFGVSGINQLKMIFLVESNAKVAQFRVTYILEDKHKKALEDNPTYEVTLMKYLLNKNAEYKLGKWTYDDDKDMYFAIVIPIVPDEKIDKSVLKRVKSMLFDDVDEMITAIYSIVDTGEYEESEDSTTQLLALLQSMTDAPEPESSGDKTLAVPEKL